VTPKTQAPEGTTACVKDHVGHKMEIKERSIARIMKSLKGRGKMDENHPDKKSRTPLCTHQQMGGGKVRPEKISSRKIRQ